MARRVNNSQRQLKVGEEVRHVIASILERGQVRGLGGATVIAAAHPDVVGLCRKVLTNAHPGKLHAGEIRDDGETAAAASVPVKRLELAGVVKE